MGRILLALLVAVGTVAGAGSLRAQNSQPGQPPAQKLEEDAGPQILTADLEVETVAKSKRVVANFAVVSSAPVTGVSINGEQQRFEKADTVMVTKVFELTAERTVITVKAVDEKGREGQRSFALLLPGAAAARKWTVSVAAELRYEVDDNPTEDLSLPFPVQGFNPAGIVADTQQADTRTTAKVTASATDGKWTAFGGAQVQSYSKSSNDNLATQTVFLGGSGRFNVIGTRDFVLTYLYADINVSGGDYSILQTLTPAWESRSEDASGTYRHTYALDLTTKDFASATQADGSQFALRWAYRRQNAAKLNSFDSVVVTGTSTEGIAETEYRYLGFDLDWKYRWEGGARFEWGLGNQVRDYWQNPHPLTTLLGTSRVDNIFRISLGSGWQFNPKWSVMATYNRQFNLSNTQPYDRSIYGLTANGVF